MTSTWWRSDASEWRSYDWTFELRGDEIADIRHHGEIVLRSVRAVVRGPGWQTVPVAVESMECGSASLTMQLRHAGHGADVSSTLTVLADEERLSFVWDAVSERAFDTCRTGLVVLHPPSDAGRNVVVVHPDGSTETTGFPKAISPHQPIRDIRELQLAGGARVQFAGDVFEMEDQRNWTDASFKTYSRPLDRPYPYALEAREMVSQSIVVGAPVERASHLAAEPCARIDLTEAGRFPEIGVEASTAPDPVPLSAVGSFRVVELDLTTPSWPAALHRAARDGKPLDVRLVTDGDAELMGAAAAALAALQVLRVAAFDSAAHVTTPAVAKLARQALRAARIEAPFVSGARSHFTELNRERGSISRDAEAIVFTVTPLFHSSDTEQLVESIAMQRLVAEQAVRLADGLEVHIGPISLRPRFNNVATTPEPAPTRANLSEGYGAQFTGASDERQAAAELGAWVIASAAALAIPGVRSLSWFETWGPRGLADATGRLPVADAVTSLTQLHGCALLSGGSPDGLVWAIGARCAGADVLLTANIDSVPRDVDIQTPGTSARRVTLAPGSWGRSAR